MHREHAVGARVAAVSELWVKGVRAVKVGDLGTVVGGSDDPYLQDGVNVRWDARRDGLQRHINVLYSDVAPREALAPGRLARSPHAAGHLHRRDLTPPASKAPAVARRARASLTPSAPRHRYEYTSPRALEAPTPVRLETVSWEAGWEAKRVERLLAMSAAELQASGTAAGTPPPPAALPATSFGGPLVPALSPPPHALMFDRPALSPSPLPPSPAAMLEPSLEVAVADTDARAAALSSTRDLQSNAGKAEQPPPSSTRDMPAEPPSSTRDLDAEEAAGEGGRAGSETADARPASAGDPDRERALETLRDTEHYLAVLKRKSETKALELKATRAAAGSPVAAEAEQGTPGTLTPKVDALRRARAAQLASLEAEEEKLRALRATADALQDTLDSKRSESRERERERAASGEDSAVLADVGPGDAADALVEGSAEPEPEPTQSTCLKASGAHGSAIISASPRRVSIGHVSYHQMLVDSPDPTPVVSLERAPLTPPTPPQPPAAAPPRVPQNEDGTYSFAEVTSVLSDTATSPHDAHRPAADPKRLRSPRDEAMDALYTSSAAAAVVDPPPALCLHATDPAASARAELAALAAQVEDERRLLASLRAERAAAAPLEPASPPADTSKGRAHGLRHRGRGAGSLSPSRGLTPVPTVVPAARPAFAAPKPAKHGDGGGHSNDFSEEVDGVAYLQLGRRLRELVLPVFGKANPRWRQAWGWFWGCVALLVIEGFMTVTFSNAQKNFTDAMSDRNEPAFWSAIHEFSYLLVALSVLSATATFAEHTAVCELRTYLTNVCLDAYLANPANPHAAYHLGHYTDATGRRLDNPAQRIVDNVRQCSEEVVHLVDLLVDKAIKVASFMYVLYTISPFLVAFALVYALTGTGLSTWMFGQALGGVQNEALKCEATLRHALIYLQQFSEEIAFYGGAKRERANAARCYDHIVHAHHVQTALDAKIKSFSKVFSFLTVLLPYVVLAQQFFASQVTFGQVTQTGSAFYHVKQGFGVMVTRIHVLSETATHLNRLAVLLDAMKAPPKSLIKLHVRGAAADAKAASTVTEEEGRGGATRRGSRLFSQSNPKHARVAAPLLVDALTVELGAAPQARVLFKDLSFALEKGMKVLVTGPNGAGKTTLLRALCGLAPGGIGDCYAPADMFVLPQRLYTPPGNLRAQLQYPREGVDPAHDGVLLDTLLDVGLGALHAAAGGLDGGADMDFRTQLSPGEQQRIGFVRLLSARPSVALLDEATSAIDEGTEAALYHLLADAVPTYMSVGHRSSLLAHHTHVLYPQDLDTAQWRLVETHEYLAGVGAEEDLVGALPGIAP
eukprot:TRINITY_DN3886_c0_g2_i1.p1 TRINITY_DN3886_c0_g2~~TRINITY_DN3886_c0_g2_i1.p1  ORF type:complete len:1313 (+),score=391.99 TRINITY_DN3886_c0_g2_i1:43-3981(+)